MVAVSAEETAPEPCPPTTTTIAFWLPPPPAPPPNTTTLLYRSEDYEYELFYTTEQYVYRFRYSIVFTSSRLQIQIPATSISVLLSWDGALERLDILSNAGPGVVDIHWKSRPVRVQCRTSKYCLVFMTALPSVSLLTKFDTQP